MKHSRADDAVWLNRNRLGMKRRPDVKEGDVLDGQIKKKGKKRWKVSKTKVMRKDDPSASRTRTAERIEANVGFPEQLSTSFTSPMNQKKKKRKGRSWSCLLGKMTVSPPRTCYLGIQSPAISSFTHLAWITYRVRSRILISRLEAVEKSPFLPTWQ